MSPCWGDSFLSERRPVIRPACSMSSIEADVIDGDERGRQRPRYIAADWDPFPRRFG